jgi:hypothetical protein
MVYAPRTSHPSICSNLVDRLHFLWTTIEQWKVSIALNNNALMTACGFKYRGHDFGWTRNPAYLRGQNLSWFATSTPTDKATDALLITSVNDRYLSLLMRGRDLHFATKEFWNSMFDILGPMICWISSFPIHNHLTFLIPQLGLYHAPHNEPCTACGSLQHEAFRCYKANPRNMYRFPPDEGWPNGSIPEKWLQTYAGTPSPPFPRQTSILYPSRKPPVVRPLLPPSSPQAAVSSALNYPPQYRPPPCPCGPSTSRTTRPPMSDSGSPFTPSPPPDPSTSSFPHPSILMKLCDESQNPTVAGASPPSPPISPTAFIPVSQPEIPQPEILGYLRTLSSLPETSPVTGTSPPPFHRLLPPPLHLLHPSPLRHGSHPWNPDSPPTPPIFPSHTILDPHRVIFHPSLH